MLRILGGKDGWSVQGKVPERRRRETLGISEGPLSPQQRTDQHRPMRKLPRLGKDPPKGLEGVVRRALTVPVLISQARKPQEA